MKAAFLVVIEVEDRWWRSCKVSENGNVIQSAEIVVNSVMPFDPNLGNVVVYQP